MGSTAITPHQELLKRDIEMWNTGETDPVDEIYSG